MAQPNEIFSRLWSSQELEAAYWALRQAWRAGPGFSLLVAVTEIFQSLIPAAVAWVALNLIDQITQVADRTNPDFSPLIPWLAAGFVLAVLQSLAGLLKQYARNRLAHQMDISLFPRILSHVGALDLRQLEDPDFQETLERSKRGPAGSTLRLAMDSLRILSNGTQVLSLIAILLFIEPLVPAILIAVGLPYAIFHWSHAVDRYESEPIRRARSKWNRYMAGKMFDAETAIETQASGSRRFLIDRYKEEVSGLNEREYHLQRKAMKANLVFAFISVAAAYALFSWIIIKALYGATTVGSVAVMGGIVLRLRGALQTLVLAFSDGFKSALHVRRIRDLLGTEPKMVPGEAAEPGEHPPVLTLADVRYTPREPRGPEITGASMIARPGETIGICGPDGAGKTTLIRLMLRFQDPDSGFIRFNDRDIRSLPMDRVRALFSVLSLLGGKYNGTLEDNIRCTAGDNEENPIHFLEEIGEWAGLNEVVAQLPDGYQTIIYGPGATASLSSRQWHSIVLARIIYRRSPIVVVNQNWGMNSDGNVRPLELLELHLPGSTFILMATDIRDLKPAQRIYLLQEGTLKESENPHAAPPPPDSPLFPDNRLESHGGR